MGIPQGQTTFRKRSENVVCPRFTNNASQNQRQLIDHLDKADIVPIDYRNLTPGNQGMVNGWIKLLTPEQQDKILILR
ncbi:hypothetical protein J0G10_13275 [Pseudomonas germanica]|uniref:CdiA C-terminal tRNase domain-containing protein n=1 Tax=Pseudomonas germanica TaxID=2815720 RepID=A0ABX8YWL5_9PSED|nr:hypothetical protein J0G10_13275 [Pseudomonas germanica]